MAKNTLTIVLDGNITMGDFSEAMKRFRSFVAALSQEVGGNTPIEWRIDELQSGSAKVTIQGNSAHPDLVEAVVQAFARAGEALQRREPIPYSEIVRRRAYSLKKLVKGSIHSIRLETPLSDALITNDDAVSSDIGTVPIHQVNGPKLTYAYGQVRGTIQTLTNRGGLRFTLYDSIFDAPISCYLNEDQEEILRGVWGRKVTVTGMVGREPYQKRAVVVRQIEEIEIIEDIAPASYRQARGIIPREEGAEKPEIIIRGIRDTE
jgi:hypothetical protein